METPEEVESSVRGSIRGADFAPTGSDRSAGAATRAVAALVLAIFLPWALLKRGLWATGLWLRRPLAAAADVGWRLMKALSTVAGLMARAVTSSARVVARVMAGFVTPVVRAGRTAVLGATVVFVRAAFVLAALAVRFWSRLVAISRLVAAALLLPLTLAIGLGIALGRLLLLAALPLAALLRAAGKVMRLVVSALMILGRELARLAVVTLRSVWRRVRRLVEFIVAPLYLVAAWISKVALLFVRRAMAVLSVVARAAILVGRGVARGGRAAYRLVSGASRVVLRWAGRLAAKLARPVLAAAAATFRLLAIAASAVTGHIKRGLTPLFGVLSRLWTQCRDGVAAMVHGVAGLGRSTAAGARVATGSALHRAGRVSLPATTMDWRSTAYADGSDPSRSERSGEVRFTLDVHENEYLRSGEGTVSAVVSVGAEIRRDGADRPEMVEVILLDCSASMAHPWDKIANARRATQAAVASLPDGVWFAVVRGAETAEIAYPRRTGLVRASLRTRQEASRAIAALRPVGGTAIGSWLELARELVALRPGALGHALLLTDGKDEDEGPDELRRVLEACDGAFQCDCRGVGTDWAVDELRTVSTALLGTVDIIKEPSGMEADFQAVIERALSRGIEASIRMRTPVRSTVTEFRQVAPDIVDLMPRARRIDRQTLEFGLGGWADEHREYQIQVEVEPALVGSEMAACRLALVAGGRTHASGVVRAVWTDDLELAAHIDADVAHYTGQAELAAAVQDGLRARREGDTRTATVQLGRAVHLAQVSGNADLLALLANVVDIIDSDTATVRLRGQVEAFDEMALDTRSTRSVRVGEGAAARV